MSFVLHILKPKKIARDLTRNIYCSISEANANDPETDLKMAKVIDPQKKWVVIGNRAYIKPNLKPKPTKEERIKSSRQKRNVDPGTTNATAAANSTTATNATTAKTEKKRNSGVLRRTNSASTLLGLSILLYPDKNEYDGVALNNFYGFRVSVCQIFELRASLKKRKKKKKKRPIGVLWAAA